MPISRQCCCRWRSAVRDAENASKVDDQGKAAEATSIENGENKIEHDTLKDEFCSDESFAEKATSTLGQEEVGDLINNILVTNGEVHQKDTE